MLWLRWLGASVGFYLFCLASSGFYLATEEGQAFIHGPSRAPTALVPVQYPVFGWPLLAARQNFEHFLNYAFGIPEVCWPGNQVNEFQVRQCQDFWYRLTSSSVFVVGGLRCSHLVLLLGFRAWVHAFYLRCRKQVDAKRALFAGKVIDSRSLKIRFRRDGFSYFFGLEPVVVQLPNRELRRLYVREGTARPEPGQTLAAFDAGSVWGEPRVIGVVFHPESVVFSGGA